MIFSLLAAPRTVAQSTTPDTVVPAFPGAMGFGAYALGGRGGSVIAVTNLNDSGPGSLRAALKQPEPRTVVFHVSGVIDLESELRISHPYATIAGQTAPGDGITLRGAGLEIITHDVVLRYLRIRPGTDVEDPGNSDALFIHRDSQRVIVDHVSLSWATDENLSIYGQGITIQNSIIAEGLINAGHPEGEHSKGAFWTFDADRVSFLRNLLAHNLDRSPYAKVGRAEIVNNVIYNPGWRSTDIASIDGPVQVNYIGNFLKNGPDTTRSSGEYLRIADRGYFVSVYVEDNLGPPRQHPSLAQPLIIRPDERHLHRTTPFDFDTPLDILSATDAFDYVLAHAGATLPHRDTVDARIVDDTRSGKPFDGTAGTIIDDPAQVGGWPTMNSETPPLDSDGDGMPDAYERNRGLDPVNPADRNIVVDGYTMLEHYLNGIAEAEAQVVSSADSG